jgi:hypothetical protein
MSLSNVFRFSEILKASGEHTAIREGCLVDTSILFAASYDLDKFNTEAVEVFDYLGELEIPLHSNVNIRAEFIDLHRRVMIPEGLVSMFSEFGRSLDLQLYTKLQSVNTQLTESRRTGSPFKLSEERIKEWRQVLRQYQFSSIDGWEQFCADFLKGKIENIWDETSKILGINFLTLRGSDRNEWLVSDVTWESMATLVGRFGIGSFDAMIINLFLSSKFSALITADKEIAYTIQKLNPAGKFVVVPDRLSL